MTDIIAMESAEPVIYGVIKIIRKDGLAGIVDLRPLLAKGAMFEFLRATSARFTKLKLEEHRYKIYWLDDQEDEIDFGSDPLRQCAERQASLPHLAS